MTNNKLNQIESKLMDEQDAYNRKEKECDMLRKKNLEFKQQIDIAYHEMENYAKILETLETNVNQLQKDKDYAYKERDKAVMENKTIRQRYMSIVGVD